MVLCFCCCCVPLWAHSIATSTSACSRRPRHCQCVLPWPYARGMAPGASRGGQASERVLGEVKKASPPMEREGNFLLQHVIIRLRFMSCPAVNSTKHASETEA